MVSQKVCYYSKTYCVLFMKYIHKYAVDGVLLFRILGRKPQRRRKPLSIICSGSMKIQQSTQNLTIIFVCDFVCTLT